MSSATMQAKATSDRPVHALSEPVAGPRRRRGSLEQFQPVADLEQPRGADADGGQQHEP